MSAKNPAAAFTVCIQSELGMRRVGGVVAFGQNGRLDSLCTACEDWAFFRKPKLKQVVPTSPSTNHGALFGPFRGINQP